jgi:hypothetical protein
VSEHKGGRVRALLFAVGDGNFVETTPSGRQVASLETDAEKGGLFAMALAPEFGGLHFVDDKENTLGLLH